MGNLGKGAFIGFLFAAFSFGSDLIGLVDLFGVRVMIKDAIPILGAFLPYIGIFFVIATAVFGVECAKTNAIRELEELQKCGEEMYKWASKDPIDMQQQPSPSVSLRHIILQRKYKRWFGDPLPEHNSVWHNVRNAAECAEKIRAYGYIRGRLLIEKDRREWNRMTRDKRVNADNSNDGSPTPDAPTVDDPTESHHKPIENPLFAEESPEGGSG